MKKLICLLVFAVVSSLCIESYGQLKRKAIKKNNRRIGNFRGKKTHFGKDKIYNSLGFGMSALNYYGDLAPRPSRFSTDISFTRPALSFSFTHRFGPRYQLTSSFMYGTLRGSDAESVSQKGFEENGKYRLQRNLSFRNRIKEISIVAQFDLFPNMATYISRVRWTPYAYLGLTVLHHNPEARLPGVDASGKPVVDPDGAWVRLRDLGTEGQYANLRETDANYGLKPYKLIQPAIPIGVGVRFRVTQLIDLSGEFGFRYLFTDYIDDVSRSYVDLGVFPNTPEGAIARAMSYRSNEILTSEVLNDETRLRSSLYAYEGRDGVTYTVIRGYGSEHHNLETGESNIRGNPKDRDIYTVFTIRATYILGKTFHRAKFR